MAGSAEFTVFDASAPDRAVAPDVLKAAQAVAADAAAGTPRRTGALAGGWTVTGDGESGATVSNSVSYGPYVEFGTRHMRGAAMLGRAVAAARSA